MHPFFNNHIIIEVDGDITIEEEDKLIIAARLILGERHKTIKLLTDYEERVI